jgi:TonB-dependent starch-binding outer membrane protein SusC
MKKFRDYFEGITRILSRKTVRIMKLTFFLSIMTIVQLFATESYSQMTKLSLKLDEVKLSDALKEIENQSEFFFLYSPKLIDVERKVSINAESEPIREILSKIFDTNVSFAVYDRQIILSRNDLALSSNETQQPKIAGTVTDERGNPLPGVTVLVKGTTIGTLTDISGKFVILNPPADAIIIFSFVGMAVQEIKAGDLTNIDVILKEEAIGLDEVVVIGYGTQKKSDLTSSISSIKGKDVDVLAIKRADQAIQGMVAGVSVQNTDGAPGGNTIIRVRGSNSILGGNNALVVIDGVQGGNLDKINPSDIASIEVLKDASATAIYGARGANGVILLTTKQGIAGKPVISYSVTMGIQKLTKKLPVLSAGDYARNVNAVKALNNISGAVTPVFSDAEIAAYDQNGGTDWQGALYKTAPIQNHQLSISGGTENVKYYVSGGYLNQEGIVVNSGYKRYSFRSNVNATFNKWLSGGVILSVLKDDGKTPYFGGDSPSGALLNTTGSILLVPRWGAVVPVYDADGNYSQHPAGGWGPYDSWNPLASAKEIDPHNTNLSGTMNAHFDAKFLNDFTFSITAIGSNNIAKGSNFYNEKTKEGLPSGGKAGYGIISNYETMYTQGSAKLAFDKAFGESHINWIAVAEQSETHYSSSGLEASKFISTQTGLEDLAGAASVQVKSFASKRVLRSYLSRMNYSLLDRYLFTASFRADGSSVFGENNKWGYFPSASLAWKLSNEDYIRNLNLFSDLKLRTSVGVTGNQAISPYQTQASISSGANYPWDGGENTNVGFGLSRPANPNLKWETTTQTNLGLDMAFFKGRLTATVDVYKKITKNLLLYRPLPLSSGFSEMIDNVGSVENKGLEIEVGGTPVSGPLAWNTSFNLAINKNKVISIGDADYIPVGSGRGADNLTDALMRLYKDEPFGQMYGFGYLGTWKTSEVEEAAKYGALPGDPHNEDINHDDKVDTEDLKVIGNSMPKLSYGWHNTLTYKNFDIDALCQGVFGNKIFNETRIRLEAPGQANSPAILNRWTPENQNTDIPAYIDAQTRLDANLATNDFADGRSQRWVEDGDYFRLKNLSIGYRLTDKIISKLSIHSLRLYISATNVFIITKYSGYDPEVSSFNQSDAGVGIDYGNYPPSRVYSFGIDVSF